MDREMHRDASCIADAFLHNAAAISILIIVALNNHGTPTYNIRLTAVRVIWAAVEVIAEIVWSDVTTR